MAQKTIFVVDDDPKVRALLRRCLEGDGCSVAEADGAKGVRAALAGDPPDLITLDLNLGAEDGLDIARSIRRDHDIPILMVTGKGDVIDRVVWLELGADHFLAKPFHVREVLARVRSVLRRTDRHASSPATSSPSDPPNELLLHLDGLSVDLDRMLLTDRDGQVCDLTTAEFRLLAAFVKNPKRPLTWDRFMNLTDKPDWTPLDRTIDSQVARLRKKVERDPAHPKLIEPVRGIGYMLTERASLAPYPSASNA